MLFLIIPLFAISCDGNGLMEYEETALVQGDVQQGLLNDGTSDYTCMVNLNLFTKPYFDYQYNTGDHVDECFVYIDNQEDFTRCLYPQSGKNVKGNFLIPFGKHRIKLNIEIDDGKSYTYPIELCNALVTLKNGEASTVLYDRIILKRADSSFTNSAFTVEFDVDFPYTENNEYTLDITLEINDETYDDGSSGPYVNGNVSVNSYYQWRSIFEPARPTDIDFVLGIVYNSTQKEYCYKGYCEQDFSIDRNGMAVNNVSWHKMVRLPNGDDIVKEGDVLYITGSPKAINESLEKMNIKVRRISSVLIAGASRIGFYLSKMLEKDGVNVTVVEKVHSKAAELAGNVPGVSVMCSDAMEYFESMSEADIKNTDAFVTLTNNDEYNLIAGMLAEKRNVYKVVTKMNSHSALKELQMNTKICSVSKESAVTDIIIGYSRSLLAAENFDAISSLYRLMDGKLEFVEFKVTSDEAYLGKLIKELQVKKGYIIASIIRNRRLIVPRGDDVIEKGDSVLVCTVNKSILRLQDIFAGV